LVEGVASFPKPRDRRQWIYSTTGAQDIDTGIEAEVSVWALRRKAARIETRRVPNPISVFPILFLYLEHCYQTD